MKTDAFGARAALDTGFGRATIYRLDALERAGVAPGLARLPFSIKVLLEAVLRSVDGELVTAEDVKNLGAWNATAPKDVELPFMPARVILQDFTGVPAVVDLASMRAAVKRLGADPGKINPLVPVDLVVDHSVQVDVFGSPDALRRNAEIEFARNRERYEFLRWGQKAFASFRVVPPATGIVHQVNLEYLAKGVLLKSEGGESVAMPDTLVGTDSHTTMINGLGVLGWGVGGIEAEAAMLGQPLYMVTPQVVGFRLVGKLRGGHDRDRPRPHRDPDAPQEGGRREVRGVLRPRARGDEPRRPRHDREHGPRVRGHLRLLPGRRRDARLSAQDGPQPGRGGARRAVLEGAGALPDPGDSRPRLHRHAGARSRDGRAEPRRSEAAARPRGALRDEGVLPQGPHGARQGARVRPRPGGHREGRCPSRCAGGRPRSGTARS